MKDKVVHKKRTLVLPMLFLTIIIIQSQPSYALSLNKEDVVIDEKLINDKTLSNEIYKEYSFENSVTIFLNRCLPLEDLFEEQVKLFNKDIAKIEKIKIISSNDYVLKEKDFEFLNNFGFKHIDLSQAKCKNNTIPAYSFSDNRDIESILFPYSIDKIGCYAFENCINLKGTLHIPDNVKEIELAAFAGCGYDNFVLPNHFDNIPKFFATRWMNLTKVELTNNIKVVNEGGFLSSPIQELITNHQVEFKENCF